MATYAIGDLQGCYDEFMALRRAVDFDPQHDKLWLTGDLVNRGPNSLAVVREVMALGSAVITVLGNHDLHLLALACLPDRAPRRKDTLDEILAAPELDAIIDWFRCQKLFHYDEDLGIAMVHAGVPAQWSVPETAARAAEVETALRDGASARAFLAAMYGDQPSVWRDDLRGIPRLRLITNYLTRMRYCDSDGRLNLSEKGAPDVVNANVRPWFAATDRRTADIAVVFGHWSTLRMSATECAAHNVYPLDTGAVWGDSLTAMRLDDRTLFSVPSTQPAAFD